MKQDGSPLNQFRELIVEYFDKKHGTLKETMQEYFDEKEGKIKYLSLFKFLIIISPVFNEMSCSAEGPPINTPILSFFFIIVVF